MDVPSFSKIASPFWCRQSGWHFWRIQCVVYFCTQLVHWDFGVSFQDNSLGSQKSNFSCKVGRAWSRKSVRCNCTLTVQVFLPDAGQYSSKNKGLRMKDEVKHTKQSYEENTLVGCGTHEVLMSSKCDCFAHSRHHAMKSRLNPSTWCSATFVG